MKLCKKRDLAALYVPAKEKEKFKLNDDTNLSYTNNLSAKSIALNRPSVSSKIYLAKCKSNDIHFLFKTSATLNGQPYVNGAKYQKLQIVAVNRTAVANQIVTKLLRVNTRNGIEGAAPPATRTAAGSMLKRNSISEPATRHDAT